MSDLDAIRERIMRSTGMPSLTDRVTVWPYGEMLDLCDELEQARRIVDAAETFVYATVHDDIDDAYEALVRAVRRG